MTRRRRARVYGPVLPPWAGWWPGLAGCEHAYALGLLTAAEIEACRAHYRALARG